MECTERNQNMVMSNRPLIGRTGITNIDQTLGRTLVKQRGNTRQYSLRLKCTHKSTTKAK